MGTELSAVRMVSPRAAGASALSAENGAKICGVFAFQNVWKSGKQLCIAAWERGPGIVIVTVYWAFLNKGLSRSLDPYIQVAAFQTMGSTARARGVTTVELPMATPETRL